MKVVDLPEYNLRLNDVAIETAPSLPESIVNFAIRLSVFHEVEKCRGLAPHEDERPLGHGLLD